MVWLKTLDGVRISCDGNSRMYASHDYGDDIYFVFVESFGWDPMAIKEFKSKKDAEDWLEDCFQDKDLHFSPGPFSNHINNMNKNPLVNYGASRVCC